MKICDHSCQAVKTYADKRGTYAEGTPRDATHSNASTDFLLEKLRSIADAISADAVIDIGRAWDVEQAAQRLSALYYGEAEPWSVDPELIARLKQQLAFGEQRHQLAVRIDVADVRALLTALGETTDAK